MWMQNARNSSGACRLQETIVTCMFVVTVSDGCFCFFSIEEDDGRSRGRVRANSRRANPLRRGGGPVRVREAVLQLAWRLPAIIHDRQYKNMEIIKEFLYPYTKATAPTTKTNTCICYTLRVYNFRILNAATLSVSSRARTVNRICCTSRNAVRVTLHSGMHRVADDALLNTKGKRQKRRSWWRRAPLWFGGA